MDYKWNIMAYLINKCKDYLLKSNYSWININKMTIENKEINEKIK